MPKLLSLSHACWMTLCGSALCFASCLAGQTASSSGSPNDPKSLLLAAVALNGVPGADAKPWHVKISFTMNTPDGKPAQQGTFEEFWAAPSEYKRTFVTPAFNQVEFGTADGPRRKGSPDSAPAELLRIVDEFLNPIPLDAAAMGAAKLQTQAVTLGTTKLVCVSAALPASATQPASIISDCMQENSPILLLTVEKGGQSKTSRDSIVKFQDHYFPQSVERYSAIPGMPPPRPGTPQPPLKPELTAKMETLEPLTAIDEAQFTPPADAVAAPKVVAMDEKTTKKQLLQHPMAEYPPAAHYAHVGGVVVVALRVQTDGHVTNLRVVSGDPLLQQAAIDAIRKWTYKPFVVDGQPVEVDTTASTTFNLMP
jgi:TonB family protein